MFALAQFTGRLGFWRLGYERHLAFNIFNAVPPHPVADRYTRPIYTSHNALTPVRSADFINGYSDDGNGRDGVRDRAPRRRARKRGMPD
jgi:hypothetical protein